MKYYTQLNNLETELIRIDTIASLVNMMTSTIANEQLDADVLNVCYLLQEELLDAQTSIREEFQNLWDVIRNDSFDEEVAEDSEEYNFDSLNNVVKEWAKS